MKKIVIFSMVMIVMGVFLLLGEKVLPYGTGDWDAKTLGNHRAVIRVTHGSGVVAAHIPWRRKDLQPGQKNIIIIDGTTGKRIYNLFRLDINREYGDLVFEPQTVPSDYFVYYLPYVHEGRKNYPTIYYPKPAETAQAGWLKKHKLKNPEAVKKIWSKLPKASCMGIQSIDEFNRFYPMEVIATAREVKKLIAGHKDKSYLLFPEDRFHPIRMTGDLPHRWIQSGLQSSLKGLARPGEFFAFQVGVYPFKKDITDISTTFSMLNHRDGRGQIPASALRCINLGGVNWTGESFKKPCPVKKNRVQALWFGVQVPRDLPTGEYQGKIEITPQGDMETQGVQLHLRVSGDPLDDGGDSMPETHSRLRWLDSRIAFDDQVVSPFTPLTVAENGSQPVVGCLGRQITLGDDGLPQRIVSSFTPEVTGIDEKMGREVLAAPFTFEIRQIDNQPIAMRPSGVKVLKKSPGVVTWQSISKGTTVPVETECLGRLEFDGFVQYKIKVKALEELEVNDIRLEIPLGRSVARYMMGLGLKGGFRPPSHRWKWDVKKNQDSLWIGDVNAGMQICLRDNAYSRPLNTNFYHSKPLVMPVSWDNSGKGGIHVIEQGEDMVSVQCYSGPRTLKPGQTLHFYFNLLLTPFKTLDTRAHFNTHFYHRYEPLEKIKATGANTINVHHATEINPFINYPFMRPNQMKAYVDDAHKQGLKVKIYNTIRELSNIAYEIFALRSLGSEVISPGPGGGDSWLQEHLGDNYIAGWYVPQYKDAAIINSGMSRWHNYYLEGINWLVKNVGIDGLYIDDLAFDRTTMKRLRKILDRGREGALIDLHSANQYNSRDGFTNSANLYLEHFPYINRLWFGEYFDYNSAPDFWLVEVSGIPFGVMGEMLQDGGNPWRGMVYGMTNRLPWAGDPSPLWRAWEDFGIGDSHMFGYWSSRCPVKTDEKDVLATAYVIKGKRTLIALAGWAKEKKTIQLTVDWQALGLDPKKVILKAPAIKDFQEGTSFEVGQGIDVVPGKGLLIVVSRK